MKNQHISYHRLHRLVPHLRQRKRVTIENGDKNALPFLKHRIFFFFGVVGVLAAIEFFLLTAESFVGHFRFYSEMHATVELIFIGALGIILWLVVKLYKVIEQTHETARVFIEHMVQGGRNKRLLQKMEIKTEEQRVLLESLIKLLNYVSETEKKLQESLNDTERSLKIKQEFLAVMSHEIRTPLNGMLGMAGLLKDTDLTPAQANYLNVIRDSGEHLLLVINDILDFSKLEAGKMNLEMVTFDVHRLIESVCELLAPTGHVKGVEVGAYISLHIPPLVRGDVARIRQVLNNLVSNAIKFTQDGAVMVEVMVETRGMETVMLKIRVSDTGIGIAQSQMSNLFQQFSQIDDGISRRFGGTGLGLSICKQLVEMMGGEITAESRLGAGSTFTFTVPVAIENTDKIADNNEKALVGKGVLVVDDHEFNRRIFKKQLENLGMEVVAVEDGPQALVALEEATKKDKSFDFMILDHQMPNMSGEEVLEHITSEGKHLDMKVLLTSSQNVSGADPYFRELGFSAVLTKPVREGSLHKWLLRLAQKDYTAEEPKHKKLAHTNLRVLVVEDNHVNQLFMQGILTRHCKVVDIAGNGVEAVSLAHKIPYDVILMDINMPLMNGLEATAEIRKMHAPFGNTPVIGVTADISPERLLECYEVGMNEVLHKPVESEKVLYAMNTVVELAKQGEDSPLAQTCAS